MRHLFLALLLIAMISACAAPLPTSTLAPTATVPLPTPSAAPSATQVSLAVTQDVAYTIPLQSDISVDTVDIYAPAAQQRASVPRVVFAHGSGEHKEDYARLYRMIAEQGAVVFGVEWPDRSPLATANDARKRSRHVSDVFACAIRFARSQFGGNPAQLILTGFSGGAGAGGVFALAGQAQVDQWDALGGMVPPPLVKCVANGSVRVDAFVGIAGPYGRGEALQKDDPALWQLTNPFAHLGDNKDLRVRLLHGPFDSVVPMDSSIQFDAALRNAGYDSQFIKSDGGHAVPFDLTVAEVVKLFK